MPMAVKASRRTWLAGNRPQGALTARCSGFTLLELLVVLAIAGMILAVTPPLFSAALPGLQMKSSARQLASALRYARSSAVTQQSQTIVTLDVANREFTVTGRAKAYEFPEQFKLKLFTARSELSEDGTKGNIRFFPDGGSTGGRVTVSYGERSHEIDVDWLTGRVRILD